MLYLAFYLEHCVYLRANLCRRFITFGCCFTLGFCWGRWTLLSLITLIRSKRKVPIVLDIIYMVWTQTVISSLHAWPITGSSREENLSGAHKEWGGRMHLRLPVPFLSKLPAVGSSLIPNGRGRLLLGKWWLYHPNFMPFQVKVYFLLLQICHPQPVCFL